MAKNIHLTLSDRIVIESSLRDGSSFKQIAQELGKDPSTISKEVRGHYKVVEKNTFNPCIMQICVIPANSSGENPVSSVPAVLPIVRISKKSTV